MKDMDKINEIIKNIINEVSKEEKQLKSLSIYKKLKELEIVGYINDVSINGSSCIIYAMPVFNKKHLKILYDMPEFDALRWNSDGIKFQFTIK